MSKLKNGKEVCDKCNRPYIADLGGKACECLIAHKPKPAKVLSYGEAVALNKVLYDALVEIAKDRNEPLILKKTWQETSHAWQSSWNNVTNIAAYALKQAEGGK